MNEIEFVLSHCEIRDKDTDLKFLVYLKEKNGSKKVKLKFPAGDFMYLTSIMLTRRLEAFEGFVEFITKIIPSYIPNIQSKEENDLFDLIMSKLEARIVKCIMTDVVNNTLQSKIVLQKIGQAEEINIPCSFSQGILYAFKSKAPIYFTEEALQKGQRPPDKGKGSDDLKERIKNIKPEEFGKFPQD